MSCDVVISLGIVNVFLVSERLYAMWQGISDNCLFDFAALAVLVTSETLFGRILYPIKWPILTR
jgi:hypothetical protein